MSEKYKLIYFNLKGRAEFIRLIFVVAGVEFENALVQFTEWPELKKTFPFAKLPVLEIDNGKTKHVIAQSHAIGIPLTKKTLKNKYKYLICALLKLLIWLKSLD